MHRYLAARSRVNHAAGDAVHEDGADRFLEGIPGISLGNQMCDGAAGR